MVNRWAIRTTSYNTNGSLFVSVDTTVIAINQCSDGTNRNWNERLGVASEHALNEQGAGEHRLHLGGSLHIATLELSKVTERHQPVLRPQVSASRLMRSPSLSTTDTCGAPT